MSFFKTIRRAVILSCCLGLAGCPPLVKVTFVNNTSSSLQIFYGTREVQFELQSGASIQKKIGYVMLRPLNIKRDREYIYNYPSKTPREFYKFGLAYSIKLQVEESMDVYLLFPDQEAPAQNFPEQPPGFPLIPLRNSADTAGIRGTQS